MLSQSLNNELTEERENQMQKNRIIMLKFAGILLQNQLISPGEKYHLTQFIRKDDALIAGIQAILIYMHLSVIEIRTRWKQ